MSGKHRRMLISRRMLKRSTGADSQRFAGALRPRRATPAGFGAKPRVTLMAKRDPRCAPPLPLSLQLPPPSPWGSWATKPSFVPCCRRPATARAAGGVHRAFSARWACRPPLISLALAYGLRELLRRPWFRWLAALCFAGFGPQTPGPMPQTMGEGAVEQEAKEGRGTW